jgi:transposase
MKVKLIGIDLAKNIFQVCAINQAGKVIFNKSVRRTQLIKLIQDMELTTIAMESCSSANYWGRKFEAIGHKVSLLPAQHCKPFVRSGKNDARDALAICEAAMRPGIHPVPIKTPAQQDIQLLHRIRQRLVRNMTALANQIRGLAREYGVVFPEGIKALCKAIPLELENGDNELTPIAREMLHELYIELGQRIEKKKTLLSRITALSETHHSYQQLLTIPGVGPVVASAILASLGDGHQFKNGRQVGAWLGLVPRQHGTGGKVKLMGITKNGDRYWRTLVIHGARSALIWSRKKDSPLARWAGPIEARRGANRATVALANKIMRISWNVLAKGEVYDSRKAFAMA